MFPVSARVRILVELRPVKDVSVAEKYAEPNTQKIMMILATTLFIFLVYTPPCFYYYTALRHDREAKKKKEVETSLFYGVYADHQRLVRT